MRFLWILRLLATASLVTVPAIGYHAIHQPSAPVPYSAHDPSPDSLVQLRGLLEADGNEWRNLVTGPGALRGIQDATETLYVAIGLEIPYSANDLQDLAAFQDRGGRLFVADAGAAANPVLERFGLSVSNRTLIDPAADAWIALQGQIGARAYELSARSASALVVATGTTLPDVIARSGPGSFLDLDADGRGTTEDLPGPAPVAALVRHEGRIQAFSADISIFLDATPSSGANQNHEFARDLVRTLLPRGGLIVFDEARHHLPPVEKNAYSTHDAIDKLHGTRAAPYLLGGLVVAGAAALLATGGARELRAHVPDLRIHTRSPGTLDNEQITRRAAQTLLGRRTQLSAQELATIPRAKLLQLTKHDPDVAALLKGSASPDQWKRIEERLEHGS